MNTAFVTELFKRSKKFFTIVNPHLFWLFVFDHFLMASSASVAYFVFIGSTRKYLDKRSTATNKYLTLRLYFDSFSTWAESNDQISLIAFKNSFSLGNFNQIERYFVKEGFVSKYDCTLPESSLLYEAGPFK